jgi:ribosomal protein L32E
MILCAMLRSKMHSDWFMDILQGRWQHGEKVRYCYPSGLKKTLCKWEVYVPLVTKGLMFLSQD